LLKAGNVRGGLQHHCSVFWQREHQHGERATWLSISGQSCLLTYNDKVAMNVRIFLVVKGHMFVSGAAQNSSLTLIFNKDFMK